MVGDSSGGPRLHRRDLLATTGVAAAGLLAGCPGDSASSGDGTQTFVAEEGNSPENVNYNRFDDTYFPGQSAELIFGPFYNSTAGQETDGDGADHVARCYRALPDHAYWDSEALPGVEGEGSSPEQRR